MSENVQPIIIKKKKVYAADGHHGGAWKVAYADFVTAMMAFFLLMWLLNATTEEQRKGIADYFSPNVPIAAISGGGSGALNGESMLTTKNMSRNGVGAASTRKEPGTDPESKRTEDPQQQADKDAEAAAQLEALNEALKEENADLAEHINLKLSPEGLVIELIDGSETPLFAIGNATPSTILEQLLDIVSESFANIENNLKIVGHTDSRAYAGDATYSNWELSTDRANTARRLLVKKGFPQYQIAEVSGKADTDPFGKNPLDHQNRRISITVLNGKTHT